MSTDQKWKWGIFIAIVAVIGWFYWRNFQQNNTEAPAVGGNVSGQTDAFFSAPSSPQAQQPSGQNAPPDMTTSNVVYGSPVGFSSGTTQSRNAAMALPANL